MRKIGIAVSAILVVAALAAIGSFAWSAPLPSGTAVVVFLPTSGDVPQTLAEPKDQIVFIGGKVVDTDLPGCISTGSFPLQNVVLVDPGSARSGRITGAVVGSQTEPIPPGTRVTELGTGVPCTSEGIDYLKFAGVTE